MLPPPDPIAPSTHPPVPPDPDTLLTAAATLLNTDPDRALDLARQAGTLATAVGADLLMARAHLLQGQSLHRLARLQDALTHLETASAAFAAQLQDHPHTQALITTAVVHRELGDHAQAHAALETALTLSVRSNDLESKAKVLNQLAALAQLQGQSELALQQLQAALDVRNALGDRLGAAQCLNNIGQVHLRRHDLGLALNTLTSSYDLLRSADDPATTATCLSNIARVHEELGDSQQCYEYTLRALDLARQQPNRTLELYCVNNLAQAINQLHRYEEAASLFTEALSLAEDIGIRYLAGCAHHGLGLAALGQGRPDAATPHFLRALSTAQDLGERENEVDALIGLGASCTELRQYDEASQHLEQALPLAVGLDDPKRTAQIRVNLARIGQSTGQLQDALNHLWSARDLERELFDQERDRRVQQLTIQFDVERARHEADVSQLQTQLAKKAIHDAEIKVARQTERLVQAQVDVVTRLANAAEYRDDLTGQHTLRVGHVAALIAERLGQSQETVSVLRVAARLHDVGKIGISDTILQKPAKLTPDEFRIMQQHTVIGEQILHGDDSPLLSMAREIALNHHEHWNGQGYPGGLSGDTIPLTARIVAVADVYDALSHARPYKHAWTHDEVMQEIARQSGRQFQPEIVAALESLHADGILPLPDLTEHSEPLHHLLLHTKDPPLPQRSNEAALQRQLDALEQRYREACAKIDALQAQVFTDALTGLANRRAFEDELETEILHAVRHSYPVSVVAIDLDNLKLLNDTEGHERGDDLLRAVSDALHAHVGPAARVYRNGGDEFAVIVKNVRVADHANFMDALARAAVAVQQRGFPGAAFSAGIASFPEEARLESDLLRLSDARMYAQKLERRGRATRPHRP